MAFRSFNSISEAARAIQDILMDRNVALPDDVRDRLRTLVGPTTSPVDAAVQGAELIYARRGDVEPEANELGAGLALVAQQYNFHGMAKNDRGNKMALAMMREANVPAPVGVEYPSEEDDPEPKSDYAPVLETDETLETPPPPPDASPAPAEGSRRKR